MANRIMVPQLCDPVVLNTAGACLLVLACYHYYTRVYNYWQRRGLKGDTPIGFLGMLARTAIENHTREAVDRTRKYGKLHGMFFRNAPQIVIADAEVLRQICIKDFDCFPNHKLDEWANSLERNFLVWTQGDHWKRVRAMMSPHFTSAKVKRMYKLLEACSEDLLENFREQLISARRDGQRLARVDLYAVYSLYTMDGITSCCYGLKLERQRGDSDIGKASARNALVRDCNQMFRFDLWRFFAANVLPKFVLRALAFHMVPESSLKPLVERVEKLVEMRRQGAAATKYDDFLQMLVDARPDDEMELTELDQAENHHAGLTSESLLWDQQQLRSSAQAGGKAQHKALATKLSDPEILGEALFFLGGGLDTTRAAMSTTTYFLAHNQEVQERLYGELEKIAQFEETPVGRRLSFDYDALTSCQYLDAVVSESLRLFGPFAFADRLAERDYHIEKYNVTIAKGTQVLLGLHSVANDPDYWEQPERFDPDRFMPGRRERIVAGSYAPFSMGPRHCLGMRFSLTETKLGLAKVLMNYKFAPAPGTRYPPEPIRGQLVTVARNCFALVNYRDEANF